MTAARMILSITLLGRGSRPVKRYLLVCLGPLLAASCAPATTELDGGRDAGALMDAADALDSAGPDAGAEDAGAEDAGADANPTDAPPCADADMDGHPDLACGGDDCDDTSAAIHPDAPEVACNE